MQWADLEVMRAIPGYQAILKAVLKSQIQMLVQQLSEHAGEEAVILTANINDGMMSHFGSESGKVFIEDHHDLKSQFLQFCLKRHHSTVNKLQSRPNHRTLNESLANGNHAINIINSKRKHARCHKSPLSSTAEFVVASSDATHQSFEYSSSHLQLCTPKDYEHESFSDAAVSHSDQTIEENICEGGFNQFGEGSDIKGSSPIYKMVELTDIKPFAEHSASNTTFNQSNGNKEEDTFPHRQNLEGIPLIHTDNETVVKLENLDDEVQLQTVLAVRALKNKCQFCKKIFGQKSDLLRHVRIHTGEKPFSCDICGREFNVKHNMVKHRMVHQKYNDYQKLQLDTNQTF